MKNKYLYLLDTVILVGTLMSIFFIYTSSNSAIPILFSPGEPSKILMDYPNCAGKDCWIYVDDNPDFSSANSYYMEEGVKINLDEGTYFWKVQGTFEHQTIKIVTKTNVNLIVMLQEKDYVIVNAGRENLQVQNYNEVDKLINGFTLAANAIKNLGGEYE